MYRTGSCQGSHLKNLREPAAGLDKRTSRIFRTEQGRSEALSLTESEDHWPAGSWSGYIYYCTGTGTGKGRRLPEKEPAARENGCAAYFSWTPPIFRRRSGKQEKPAPRLKTTGRTDGRAVEGSVADTDRICSCSGACSET